MRIVTNLDEIKRIVNRKDRIDARDAMFLQFGNGVYPASLIMIGDEIISYTR